jgi:hypothetical protein
MEIKVRIDPFNDHHIVREDSRARGARKLTTLLHQEAATRRGQLGPVQLVDERERRGLTRF